LKLITRDADYAIRALCCIAKHDKDLVSSQELGGCLKIPRPFLRKILQILNKKGLVESFKGKGGGFRLRSSPKEISIMAVVRAFQGPLKLNEHMFRKKKCPHVKSCRLKRKTDHIEEVVTRELASTTIASLL